MSYTQPGAPPEPSAEETGRRFAAFTLAARNSQQLDQKYLDDHPQDVPYHRQGDATYNAVSQPWRLEATREQERYSLIRDRAAAAQESISLMMGNRNIWPREVQLVFDQQLGRMIDGVVSGSRNENMLEVQDQDRAKGLSAAPSRTPLLLTQGEDDSTGHLASRAHNQPGSVEPMHEVSRGPGSRISDGARVHDGIPSNVDLDSIATNAPTRSRPSGENSKKATTTNGIVESPDGPGNEDLEVEVNDKISKDPRFARHFSFAFSTPSQSLLADLELEPLKSYVKTCSVLFKLFGDNLLEAYAWLHCCDCPCNTNNRGEFLKGFQGLINHFRDNHPEVYQRLTRVQLKLYLLRNAVKILDDATGRELELDPSLLTKLDSNWGVVSRTSRDAKILRREADPGEPKIWHLKADALVVGSDSGDIEGMKRLHCPARQCGTTADANGRPFATIAALEAHYSMMHQKTARRDNTRISAPIQVFTKGEVSQKEAEQIQANHLATQNTANAAVTVPTVAAAPAPVTGSIPAGSLHPIHRTSKRAASQQSEESCTAKKVKFNPFQEGRSSSSGNGPLTINRLVNGVQELEDDDDEDVNDFNPEPEIDHDDDTNASGADDESEEESDEEEESDDKPGSNNHDDHLLTGGDDGASSAHGGHGRTKRYRGPAADARASQNSRERKGVAYKITKTQATVQPAPTPDRQEPFKLSDIQHSLTIRVLFRYRGKCYKFRCSECQANCNQDGEYFANFRELARHVDDHGVGIFVDNRSDAEIFEMCAVAVDEHEYREYVVRKKQFEKRLPPPQPHESPKAEIVDGNTQLLASTVSDSGLATKGAAAAVLTHKGSSQKHKQILEV